MDSNIRNFCILAHVDHGKSTLADRFLEITGTVEKRKMREQFLDMNPLEREKGITIKMQPVRMIWRPNSIGTPETINPKSEIRNKSKIQNPKFQNDFEFRASNFEFSNSGYILNLIDTPGHADFSYEVSRALAAVEGAILLVDATQGVQAQTFANLELAKKEGLTTIPAINKIDLVSAEVERCEKELKSLLDESGDIYRISAKTGEGVEELLRAVVERVPPPKPDISIYRNIEMPSAPRALIFDSIYDPYQGVIAHVRVFDGEFKKGDRIYFMAVGVEVEILEVGIFKPDRSAVEGLSAGEIGYIATGIKEPERVRVGDTITRYIDISKFRNIEALPGYKEPTPVVFASLFPENQDDYDILRDSLRKLKLNDAAIQFEPEESQVLGRGFRAGFLGLLHMEIVVERLRREFNIQPVLTNPSVAYRLKLKKGGERAVYSAEKFPESHEIVAVEEPWAVLEIITPAEFLGALTTLVYNRAGSVAETRSLGEGRLFVKAEAPLRNVVVDFYDDLKSVSRGFASMAYELSDYRAGKLVRLDILVAGERVGALSEIVSEDEAYHIGRERVLKLKDILKRELFAVSLQASVGGRILARETVPALRKDVTGYLYGGDRTRKMKLWKKQQKGKKKLKEMGKVEIPAEVFLKMLKPR